MTEQPLISIRNIQLLNLLFIAVMGLVATLADSLFMGLSVVAGGLLATVSFISMKRDIHRIFSGPIRKAKLLFLIKYYARLSLLAVILYMIVRHQVVNVIGLLTGLSSVVVSILLASVAAARKRHCTMKEAL